MLSKRTVCIVVAVVFMGVAFVSWKLTARGAYESAEYVVLESDGPYEIRDYSDLMMATTNARFKKQGRDGSFMRLFRYISGANELERKVAMTTPVFMRLDSEGVPGRMGFVVPKSLTGKAIPIPSDDTVQITRRIGGDFAVLRFNGNMDAESVAQKEADLQEWIKARGLYAVGEAELAGYDPPWTPGVLRRNEVLIRVGQRLLSLSCNESLELPVK